MQCPKCGAEVSDPKSIECPACGVILAKASAFNPPRDTYRPAPATQAAPPKSSISAGLYLAAAVVVLWFGWRAFSQKAPASAGTWYLGASGYERTMAEQKTNSKPVLVYFHAEWCGYCRMLENDVFSTRTFASRYGSIVKVKVNPEEGAADRDLARQYSVTGYPTVYVIAKGSRRGPIVGHAPPDQYYEALNHSIGD